MHENIEPLELLDESANLAEVIEKLNEIIEVLNFYWHPES
jgi:hypothetical protein